MNKIKSCAQLTGLFFAATLAVWAVFSWPLPRYALHGIPSTDRNTERYNVRNMAAGDHLQLLYHFWLAADMLAGDTPWFYNLYEFNQGNDAERYQPGSYYLPASAVYAVGHYIGGHAVGWNLTGFISLLLSGVFSWLLARRLGASRYAAHAAFLIAVTFPYRWITLLTGSPTGFAMEFVPMAWWGLDRAVRDEKIDGGIVAGLAVLSAYGVDAHVFYFLLLALPVICVMSFLLRETSDWLRFRTYLKTALALLPTVLLSGAAIAVGSLMARGHAETDVAGGRSVHDVLLFSPQPRGLISWSNLGPSNHAFFGISAFIFVAVLMAVLLVVRQRDVSREWRKTLLSVMLFCGMAVIICLALGMRGPFEAIFMRAARKLIPHYNLIRQPMKIFSLMPVFLVVMTALNWDNIYKVVKGRTGRLLAALLLAVCLFEWRMQLDASVSLLEEEQPAYRAVAEDARARGKEPRTVITTLWPGDSHWTSLYQYYVSLYRIRMLNGYSPVVRQDYIQDVFYGLESINQGVISANQREYLRRMKIDYIIFQEGPYPEKVAPFPVAAALRRMLENPYLELLEKSGIAWAFRILDKPEPRAVAVPQWNVYPPARFWELENSARHFGRLNYEEGASNRNYLSVSNNTVNLTVSSVANAPGLSWLVRWRGNGMVSSRLYVDSRAIGEALFTVDTTDWEWIQIPVQTEKKWMDLALDLDVTGGQGVDFDLAMLAAGEWPRLLPGEVWEIPAACLFRAGFIDQETDEVVFLRDNEGAAIVLYGPRLPLPPGYYKTEMIYSSTAENGVRLGTWIFDDGSGEPQRVRVEAGSPAVTEYKVEYSVPFVPQFEFARNGDMRIKAIVITRLR